jgi:hypothetical protein
LLIEGSDGTPLATAQVKGTAHAERRVGASTSSSQPSSVTDTETKPAAAPTAALQPSTEELDFERQGVGTKSTPQSLSLKNTGQTDLIISYESFGEGQLVNFPTQALCNNYYLAAGQSCTEQVQFAPETEGRHTAVFTVRAIAKPSGRIVGNLATFKAVGEGIKPHPAVDPATLTFSLKTREEQTTTVRNAGTAPLLISRIRVEGPNAARFTAEGSGCIQGPLAPLATCLIKVTHRPDGEAAHHAELLIDTDSSGEMSVPLTWTAPPSAVLSASPNGLIFNRRTAYLQSTTISNTGHGASEYLNVRLDSKSFRITSNQCRGSLQPGSSCSITVEYVPQAAPAYRMAAPGVAPAASAQEGTLSVIEGMLHQKIDVTLQGN